MGMSGKASSSGHEAAAVPGKAALGISTLQELRPRLLSPASGTRWGLLLLYLLRSAVLAWAQTEAAVGGLQAEGSVRNVLLSRASQGGQARPKGPSQ